MLIRINDELFIDPNRIVGVKEGGVIIQDDMTGCMEGILITISGYEINTGLEFGYLSKLINDGMEPFDPRVRMHDKR